MITRLDLDARVAEWQLQDHVVEKDYVLGWLLWGIGRHPQLSVQWAFKGGTCLKKCYVETFRFSEDLDFTVLPGGPFLSADVLPLLAEVLDAVGQEAGLDFSGRPPVLRVRPDGRSTEGRVYYRGPRRAPQEASVKIDLSAAERVVRPTVLRAIGHAYPDRWAESVAVRCYGFEEVFAEKLRALSERCRPRDLYDVVQLYRRPDLHAHAELLAEVLRDKCTSKGIAVPTLAGVATPGNEQAVRAEWDNMLRHQLPALPPFESFWSELPAVFAWLEGAPGPTVLPQPPRDPGEDTNWSPPPLVATWGSGAPLEVLRFAGANHLCVDLDYQGSRRRIEPYSLRRTRDGNLIVHAVRSEDGQHRAYRVDRIGAVRTTEQVFAPRYAIEFTPRGAILAPPTTTKPPPPRAPGRAGRRRSGPIWVVECIACGRHFARVRQNWRLKRHGDRTGYPCPGRRGWLVGTRL